MLQIDLHEIGASASPTLIPLIVLVSILAIGFICKYTVLAALRHSGGWRRGAPRLREAGLPPFPRLPIEAQWSRVTTVVETTVCSARRASEHHAVAGLRLDAAEYAFRRMLLELGTVAPQPLAVSAVPPPAEAHELMAPSAALAA